MFGPFTSETKKSSTFNYEKLFTKYNFKTKTKKNGNEKNSLVILTPMIAFSSGIVTCFARSTACATCC